MSGGHAKVDNTASDAAAGAVQDQKQLFDSLFAPVRNNIVSQLQNPNALTDAANQAKTFTDQSFDPQQVQRRLAGLGITPTAAQQAEIARQAQLSKSLGEVNAMNNAVGNTYDTITNGLQTMSNMGASQAHAALAGLGAATDAQTQLNLQNQQAAAGGGLGSALGGAASGAAAGSVAGPWGALAGGVIGGALGAFS